MSSFCKKCGEYVGMDVEHGCEEFSILTLDRNLDKYGQYASGHKEAALKFARRIDGSRKLEIDLLSVILKIRVTDKRGESKEYEITADQIVNYSAHELED